MIQIPATEKLKTITAWNESSKETDLDKTTSQKPEQSHISFA